MSDIAYYLAGAVAVLGGMLKLLRAGRRPATLYLSGAMICLGLGCVVLAPATLILGSHVEPLANLSRLLGNGLVVCGEYCVLGLLAHAARAPDDARHRMRLQAPVLLGVLGAMACLLVAARTRFTVDFVNAYAGHPLVVAYEVVFLGYAAWATLGMLLLASAVARHADRTALRAGLRVGTAGAGVGLVWATFKVSMTLLRFSTGAPVTIEGPVSSLLSALSIGLLALGATVSTWGPRVERPVVWWRSRRACERIEPLWSALLAELPELALDAANGGVEYTLYRKVVEIRDSSLAMRVYFHPAVPTWAAEECAAAGVRDEAEVAVLTEAASLAAAVEAHRRRYRYHDTPGTAAAPHELDPHIDVEIRWLSKVSVAFTDSPIVDTVRQRVRAELTGRPVTGRG